MNAIDAGFAFAGDVGIEPRGKTLNMLWRMAEGRARFRRREQLELAALVWNIGDIDWDDYLRFGEMSETNNGGPVQLEPEMQARVDAEIERIRRENPSCPKVVA